MFSFINNFEFSKKSKVVIYTTTILTIMISALIGVSYYYKLSNISIIKITLCCLLLSVLGLFAYGIYVSDEQSIINEYSSEINRLASNGEYELIGNKYEYWLYQSKKLILYAYLPNQVAYIITDNDIIFDKANIRQQDDRYLIQCRDIKLILQK